MLYILGAAPRSGKSIISQKVLKEQNIPFKEMLDIIRQAVEFSKYIEVECKMYNIPYFDGSDKFNTNIKQIIKYFKTR